jgi:hypothetical protein
MPGGRTLATVILHYSYPEKQVFQHPEGSTNRTGKTWSKTSLGFHFQAFKEEPSQSSNIDFNS